MHLFNIGTTLFTWAKGKQIGSDQFGNRYFIERSEPKGRARKRWVLFAGEVEASSVPPEWHAWLSYTTDEPLTADLQEKPWLKPHQANLTGSAQAYLPPGHDLRGGRRERAAGEYQAWQP